MESVIYDGVTWHQRPSGHYHNKRRGYLHRYIWERANGSIQKGFVIHHADHNVQNNDLSNLELMAKSDHQRHHRVGGKNSEAQKAAARKTLESLRTPKVGRCILCDKEFVSFSTTKVGLFCSRPCLDKWRDNRQYPKKASCVECGCEYMQIRESHKLCSNGCRKSVALRSSPSKKRRTVAQLADVQPDS